MGTRGPIGKGQRGKPVVSLVIPPVEGEAIIPAAPASYLPSTVEAWTAFWSSPLGQSTPPEMAHAVRRYFGLVDEYDRAMTDATETPFIDGSKGQPVLNPRGKYAKELLPQLLAMENAFALSLSARARLGVQVGTAALTAAQLNEMTRRDDNDDTQDEAILAEWTEEASS